MSHSSSVTGLQIELDALSRRRRSLEAEISYLEQKINVVNQNLQKNINNEKLMSLMNFLETEKKRIQNSKLSKVYEKSKLLENKISTKRNSQNYSVNETIIDRPKSFHQHNETLIYGSRKYQSLPTFRLHTTNDLGSFTSESHKTHEGSTTHLPMCMSMKVCKECTALRGFFVKNQGSKLIDGINVHSSENQTQFCMRCKMEFLNQNKTSQHINEEKENEISKKHPFDSNSFISNQTIDVQSLKSSISASILATCESYAFCECCNNTLSKLSLPTPSPSVVEISCISHENCTKCMEALVSSKNVSSNSSKSC